MSVHKYTKYEIIHEIIRKVKKINIMEYPLLSAMLKLD